MTQTVGEHMFVFKGKFRSRVRSPVFPGCMPTNLARKRSWLPSEDRRTVSAMGTSRVLRPRRGRVGSWLLACLVRSMQTTVGSHGDGTLDRGHDHAINPRLYWA